MLERTAKSTRSPLKQFLFTTIFALSCLLPHQTHTLTNGEKGGTFLLASIMLSLGKNKLSNSAFTKKLAWLTNTDSHDLVDASVLSTYYWAWSYLYKGIARLNHRTEFLNSWATDLRYQATIQPLIQIAATSKIYNKLFKNTPGLSALACSDSDCQGVCDACEYKHLVRKAPLELGMTIAPMLKPSSGIEGHGECNICNTEEITLMPSMCQGIPCDFSRSICRPCSLALVAPGQPQRCPGCRAGIAALPALYANSAVSNPFAATTLLSQKLYHIAFWEPFWTLCRQENNFLHRLGLELRKINPLVRWHISCKDRHVHSICHQCKLKKIFHIHDWAKYLNNIGLD